MGWKNWPFWLKGGIYGIVLGIFVALIVPIGCSDFYRIGPVYPSDQPLCYWFVVNGRWRETSIVIFILGLLMGWIYGKIKTKSN